MIYCIIREGNTMKYSTKLSDSVHILIFIALNDNQTLSSTDMAISIQTNPAYVRQLMAKLKAAELIKSKRGQANPTIGKSPKNITLLEIYRAVEGEKPLLHLDTHTNPDCGIGINIQLSLAEYYNQIQENVEKQMQHITLQHIIDSYHQRTSQLI